MTILPRHELRHADGRRLLVYGRLNGSLDGGAPRPRRPDRLHQRWDPILRSMTAVSPARNARPHDDRESSAPADFGSEVPFPFDAAVFENRWPALVSAPPAPPPDPGARPSVGRCEVVLYTDARHGSLRTLTPQELARVVAIWRDRSAELWSDERHAFVMVFENRGPEVGATMAQPHGQIYAFDHLPPSIERKADSHRAHREARGGCLSCAVADRDAASDREIISSAHFSISVPFAARWPYEVHLRARRHGLRRLTDLTDAEATALSRGLREIVCAYDSLFGFDLPYMMVAQEAPAGCDDWHLAFEFLPPHRSATKLKIPAAVETATGLFINDVLPEESAQALRAAAARQHAPFPYQPVPRVRIARAANAPGA